MPLLEFDPEILCTAVRRVITRLLLPAAALNMVRYVYGCLSSFDSALNVLLGHCMFVLLAAVLWSRELQRLGT